MRKIDLIALTSIFLAVLGVTPAPAWAATASNSARLATVQNNRIENIKSRGDAEINRRLTSLNSAMTRINNAKHISASDKQTLTNNIQGDITDLTNLKSKIDGDTDLTTLKTDVQSIVKDYRVYLVFLPQTRITGAADSVLTVVDQMNDMAAKLDSRIQQAQSQGKDVTNLQNELTDMKAKVADAQTQANASISEVLPLTPQGYPDNKTTLVDARSKVKTAVADLKAARADISQIMSGLKNS